MQIKNLNIFRKGVSKLAALGLVVVLGAGMLTGCSNDNLLKDTILEKSVVVTFADGSKEIAVAKEYCGESEYCHYRSVTSGAYFCDEACDDGSITHITHHYEIVSEEVIIHYLTADEITKAANGELTEADVAAIINRVVNPIVEETNVKSK